MGVSSLYFDRGLELSSEAYMGAKKRIKERWRRLAVGRRKEADGERKKEREVSRSKRREEARSVLVLFVREG